MAVSSGGPACRAPYPLRWSITPANDEDLPASEAFDEPVGVARMSMGVAADVLDVKQHTFRVVADLHTYVLAPSLPAGRTPATRERRVPTL